MTRFPWEAAMRFGFGTLKLGPREFWALTPRELGAAFSAFAPEREAPPRTALDALMARFPDGGDDGRAVR